MNILQVNATYGLKSTGTIVADIGKCINDSGGCAFFAYQSTSEKIENSIKIGNTLDWKMHAVLSRVFGKQGFFSSLPTLKLIRFIKSKKIDIVHLHNLHSNYVNIKMLLRFLSKNNIPVVITLHDCWWFTGKCFHYIDCSCDKFVTGCGKCPKKKNAPRMLFLDNSHTCWQSKKELLLSLKKLYLVGCSRWICSESQKSFLKNVPTFYINNGVDVNIFKPMQVENIKNKFCPNGEFLILGMANKWFLPENNKIFNIIKTIKNSKVLLVGCSNNQILECRNKYPEFIPVGYVSDKRKLALFYNLADVFINPTHADTLPTVNMESICCGTPVITFSCGGSGELVDNETGIVIKENDFESLVKSIEKIKNNHLENCSNIGITKFDNKKSYLKYISLYEEIMNDKKP